MLLQSYIKVLCSDFNWLLKAGVLDLYPVSLEWPPNIRHKKFAERVAIALQIALVAVR
jgi:hypothetical protein